MSQKMRCYSMIWFDGSCGSSSRSQIRGEISLLLQIMSILALLK
ncbi:hypothetical protein [Phormidesmis priestleyi]